MVESVRSWPQDSKPRPTSHVKSMSRKDIQFVVITPVRDEEQHLKGTIESVVAQTIRPAEWIIVDDGSTDGTASIIAEYARTHSWIRAVHRANRGFRLSGGGVVDAFNDGYKTLESENWQFIVKLDGDLSFPPDYFEKCFEHFEQETSLGVGGGVICHDVSGHGHLRVEENPRFHVRGATKIYRRECWDAIGGFWPAPGWDTMDEVKASMLGWSTRSFPDLQLLHHRVTGGADGTWANSVKNGRANYICGYHPLFMMFKCVIRLAKRPFLIPAIGLFYGFISGYLTAIPQVDDAATIRYLRKQQIRRLLLKDSIWK